MSKSFKPIEQWTEEDYARWAKTRIQVGREFVAIKDNPLDPWILCVVRVVARHGTRFRCRLANVEQQKLAKRARTRIREFTSEELW